MTLPKHLPHHYCDVMGFKPCLYSPIQFKMLACVTIFLGVVIQGYDNTNNRDLLAINSQERCGRQLPNNISLILAAMSPYNKVGL